jgi:hypothetical protein
MSKQQLQDFLEILDSGDKKQIKVSISSKKSISVSPLSFKQQKSLITTGLDGIAGVMVFVKNLNDIILKNTEEEDLKIYDRVPITLALRKNLSSKKIEKDEHQIDVDDLIAQFKKFDMDEVKVIEGDGFKVYLRIPTLKQENKLLSICIEDLKKIDVDSIGKNISLILSYEIPKFIDSIVFGENTIIFDDLSVSDRTKIMDNLPANVTNTITDYIMKVREYDESLLTFSGVTIDIDSSFFE